MLRFLLGRLANGAIVMVLVSMLSFSLFNFIGDPVSNLVGENATLDEREAMRRSLGLDQPLPLQYLKFVGRAVQGEFGVSYRNIEPVSRVIASRLPATLELSLVAAVLALGVGIPMGVYAGLKPRSLLTRGLQVVSLVGISVPSFVTGIILILIFSIYLNWLPSFGRGDTVMLGVWSSGFLTTSGWKSLVMPAITLALFQLTLFMRLTRTQMMEVLR
ncbi:MAG: ABC transporter permease, partial [Polaromonas sp.]